MCTCCFGQWTTIAFALDEHLWVHPPPNLSMEQIFSSTQRMWITCVAFQTHQQVKFFLSRNLMSQSCPHIQAFFWRKKSVQWNKGMQASKPISKSSGLPDAGFHHAPVHWGNGWRKTLRSAFSKFRKNPQNGKLWTFCCKTTKESEIFTKSRIVNQGEGVFHWGISSKDL